MAKFRKIENVIYIVAVAVTIAIAFHTNINPETSDIIGAFAAGIGIMIVGKIINIGEVTYGAMLIFAYLASPIGSVLNVYDTCAPYDKIIHLCSGIILAAVGMAAIKNMISNSLKKEYPYLENPVNNIAPILKPIILMSVMFSIACAGLWEIFEYVMDIVITGNMQRGMEDTITDMIAGSIGAVIYYCWISLHYKILKKL